MTKLLNKSNRTRNRRKKTAERVKSFRNKQKALLKENKSFITDNDAVYTLFDAYAKSKEEFEELCRLYREESEKWPEIGYLPKIDLLDIWNNSTNS